MLDLEIFVSKIFSFFNGVELISILSSFSTTFLTRIHTPELVRVRPSQSETVSQHPQNSAQDFAPTTHKRFLVG